MTLHPSDKPLPQIILEGLEAWKTRTGGEPTDLVLGDDGLELLSKARTAPDAMLYFSNPDEPLRLCGLRLALSFEPGMRLVRALPDEEEQPASLHRVGRFRLTRDMVENIAMMNAIFAGLEQKGGLTNDGGQTHEFTAICDEFMAVPWNGHVADATLPWYEPIISTQFGRLSVQWRDQSPPAPRIVLP